MTPMCKNCGEYEIGTFQAHDDVCSDGCMDEVMGYIEDLDWSEYDGDLDEIDPIEYFTAHVEYLYPLGE